ncbi:MAG TPA: D-2-hydroxyacid dehydrogenase [Burkholderiales bacterium]|nr:D-2-hydroxyacid dehydrogenase [Burkholderiales bacterium]
MSKPVCVLWLNESPTFEQALERKGVLDRLEIHSFKRDQALPDDLAGRAEILVGWEPDGALKQASRLRWVQTMTAGVESWLESPDLPDSVTLTCARGSHRLSMPENILGALFHLTKPFMPIVLDQRESRWTRRTCGTLAGKTLGILGLGAVGQELARKAAGLDMRVIGTRRTASPVAHVDKVYGSAETDEVLAASDYVVVLLPATPDTDRFINAARLKRMKPTAYLINFARGAVIHDEDLIAAVKAKTIAGAVLDVFRQEPLPASDPFWQTEGILVLPHIGGGHPGRSAAVADIFAENARRYLAGEPMTALVDRARGY